jgi:hypothetical protein
LRGGPDLDKGRPGWIARFDAAHADHEHEIAELRALSLALGETRHDRDVVHRTLYLRFSRFVADNLAHMLEEETEVGPLLESLYSQGELEELESHCWRRSARMRHGIRFNAAKSQSVNDAICSSPGGIVDLEGACS